MCVDPFHALAETVIRVCTPPAARVGSTSSMDTVITRKIDDLGRIVIPAETRRMFNIREGDQLFISVEAGNIVLRKMIDTCTFCGSDSNVSQFKGKGICAVCKGQLSP